MADPDKLSRDSLAYTNYLLETGSSGAATGAQGDAAWDGESDDASVVSLLKAIHDLLVIVASNTTPE